MGLPAGSVPFEAVHKTGASLWTVSVDAVAACPEKALLAIELFRSGWPTTKLAGAAFEVGMLFQIRTRLKPRSVTYSRIPSEVTATGLSRFEAVALDDCCVRSGC